MFGQGSPQLGGLVADDASARRKRARGLPRVARFRLWIAPAVFLLLLLGVHSRLWGEQLRVRVAWGVDGKQGAPRQWRGAVEFDQGRVLHVRGLGLTPDTPGSIFIRPGGAAVEIMESSPRVYNGVDILVDAPLDAVAKLTLRSGDSGPTTLTATLRELASNAAGRVAALDNAGNRVLMQRSPGDTLRFEFERDSVVMTPGESVAFQIRPHLLTSAANEELVCRVRLLQGDEERHSMEQPVKLDGKGSGLAVPFQFTLPSIEGVFTFEVSLRRRSRVPWLPSPGVATRRMQVVLVDRKPPPPSPQRWREVYGFDPANKGWFDRVARLPGVNAIPGLTLAPIESEAPKTRDVRGQLMTELASDGWVAYPLSISPEQMHLPHVLELEYPTSSPQSFSVSILEPNRAREVAGKNLDSGVSVGDRWADPSPGVERYRLVFWPRTSNPFVLIANRHPNSPAVFGKIRVLAGPDRIDEAAAESLQNLSSAAVPLGVSDPPRALLDERMVAAFFESPAFAECFGSDQAADPARADGSLDDWYTFYRAGARLAQYLRYAGYNTAVICVARDGGAIYPSDVLQPTPRYDNGVFFRSGQDPMQKDVLEMLFRIFDREGIRLIPAVRLSGVSPRLELLRRNGARGVALEGAGGATKFNGQIPGPYYNALDPRVQEETRRVVRELIQRYAAHPSFGGVALQCGADTWTQLPDAQFGVDPVTLDRFAQQTNRQPLRAADERKLLVGQNRTAWLRWRAQTLAEFHQSIEVEVQRSRRGATFLLTTEDVLQSASMRASLRPRAGQPDVLSDHLLRVGLSPNLYQRQAGAALLRPYRFSHSGNVAFESANLTLNQRSLVDRQFGGVQFHHDRAYLAVPDFDDQTPFRDARTKVRLQSVFTPSGLDARKRFARAFGAQDVRILVDGGQALPIGQEQATRSFMHLMRSLPAIAFRDVPATAERGSPAAVVRQHQVDGENYLYAVNQAPWPQDIRVELSGAVMNNIRALGGVANGEVLLEGNSGWIWRVRLESYGAAAVVLPADVRAIRWLGVDPAMVVGQLQRRIENVQRRIAGRNREAADKPRNLSFEQPGKEIAGWRFAKGPNFQFEIQPDGPSRVLHLKNKGPDDVLWARSSRFRPPETGMLAVRVRLRADQATQPQLAVAVDTERGYYDPLFIGKGTGIPINPKWREVPFLFKLPPDLSEISIGFDVYGAGEVWIDRIEVFDIWLEPEHRALTLHSGMAKNELVRGNAFDCQLFLESYWPQFLLQHDPAAAPRAARREQPARGWRFPKLPGTF